MKRVRNTLTVMQFAYRAIVLIWQEQKIALTWRREGKQLSLVVTVYNHLFDDEWEAIGAE